VACFEGNCELIFGTSNAIQCASFLLLKKKKGKQKKEKKRKKEKLQIKWVAWKLFAISLFGSSLEVSARFVARLASVREVVILVLIVEVFLLPSL